jgi:hypothetical protein
VFALPFDSGHVLALRVKPTIGNLPLPSRGAFFIGQAMWQIRDPKNSDALVYRTEDNGDPMSSSTMRRQDIADLEARVKAIYDQVGLEPKRARTGVRIASRHI